jgi:hypothetical protein
LLDLAHRRGSGRHHLIATVNATAVLPPAVRDALLHDVLAVALTSVRGEPVRPVQPGPTLGSRASCGRPLSGPGVPTAPGLPPS